MSGALPPLYLYAFMKCSGTTWPFPLFRQGVTIHLSSYITTCKCKMDRKEFSIFLEVYPLISQVYSFSTCNV